MKDKRLTVPELILIAGTRVALGVGIGLLISDKLSVDARKRRGSGVTCCWRVEYDPTCDECTRRAGGGRGGLMPQWR